MSYAGLETYVVTSPWRIANDPRTWGGEDVPLSEAAEGGKFTKDLPGIGGPDTRMQSVVEGDYKDYEDSTLREKYAGYGDTRFPGGVLGGGEKALRVAGSLSQDINIRRIPSA